MKKTILTATLVLLVALGSKAQDTIVSLTPKDNYLYTNWLNKDTCRVMYFQSTGRPIVSGVDTNAKSFYTKDSLTVYGIAVMLDLPLTSYPSITREQDIEEMSKYILDPVTHDFAFEEFALYVPGPNNHPVQFSERKRINFFDSAASYFLRMDLVHPMLPEDGVVANVHPVWETYFTTPYTMIDTFYVSASHTSAEKINLHIPADTVGDTIYPARDFLYDYWPIQVVCFLPQDDGEGIWDMPRPERVWSYKEDRGWFYDSTALRTFLFPILTPPDSTIIDTTIVDTTIVDTVGIGMVRLLERYVGLQPNPASERVLVTSSFGLRRIEVYNTAGAKVAEQPATGYSAMLDVAALPEGSYLVRIATPSGNVTKKLLIQRR